MAAKRRGDGFDVILIETVGAGQAEVDITRLAHTTLVVEAPGFQVSYATGNVVVNVEQKLGSTTLFDSNLAWADSLKEESNYLATWHNDLSTTLSRRLALKLGYVMTYNNRPASQAVPIILTGSAPPVVLGHALVQLKKLDTLFNLSLVISF